MLWLQVISGRYAHAHTFEHRLICHILLLSTHWGLHINNARKRSGDKRSRLLRSKIWTKGGRLQSSCQDRTDIIDIHCSPKEIACRSLPFPTMSQVYLAAPVLDVCTWQLLTDTVSKLWRYPAAGSPKAEPNSCVCDIKHYFLRALKPQIDAYVDTTRRS